MRILIYGSSHLCAVTCSHLLKQGVHELVGHVPCSAVPTVPGKIPVAAVDPRDVAFDIRLSIQFNEKLKEIDNSYNVHTGLLPEWGGVDILYHSLKMGTREQGLTFHKMTHQFDHGPIISKMTYPVFSKDTILDLYERLLTICPEFVASSLGLLCVIGAENADRCVSYAPTMYRRNAIDLADVSDYRDTPRRLREKFLA